MFLVGIREIGLSRRNAVHNGPAEHNQTLNIEAGVVQLAIGLAQIARSTCRVRCRRR